MIEVAAGLTVFCIGFIAVIGTLFASVKIMFQIPEYINWIMFKNGWTDSLTTSSDNFLIPLHKKISKSNMLKTPIEKEIEAERREIEELEKHKADIDKLNELIKRREKLFHEVEKGSKRKMCSKCFNEYVGNKCICTYTVDPTPIINGLHLAGVSMEDAARGAESVSRAHKQQGTPNQIRQSMGMGGETSRYNEKPKEKVDRPIWVYSPDDTEKILNESEKEK